MLFVARYYLDIFFFYGDRSLGAPISLATSQCSAEVS